MALTEINSKGIKDGDIVNTDIADDTIAEAKLDIHADPSGTDKFLKYTSNGMEWVVPSYTTNTDTNTNVLAGGTITGDVVFDNATNAGKDITWDMSDNALEFIDDVKAAFGTSGQFTIKHNGSHGLLTNTIGNLTLASDNISLANAADSEGFLSAVANGAVSIKYNDVKKFETTAAGVTVTGSVTDDKGDVRSIPKVAKTSAYTLVASDAGKCISTNSGVTIPDAVFSAGDAVTIWNDSSSSITITQGSNFQLRKAGETSTGNVTLNNFGIATLWWNTGGTAVISGNLG